MAIISHQNFSWSETAKDLVIFVPNYGRENYIRFSAENLFSEKHKDKYLIIVLNDGIHSDFEDLRHLNFRYLTLQRDPPISRNGSLIRNFGIKRCESRLTGFKDPETIPVHPDGPDGLIESMLLTGPKAVWRPGYNQTMTYEDTLTLMSGVDKTWSKQLDIAHPDNYARVHWLYCIETEVLKSLRAYSEQINLYGPEDADLLLRLFRMGYKQHLDFDSTIFHLWHEIPQQVYKDNWEMQKVFRKLDHREVIRNDENWGEG